jgi:hypothetical protein
MSNNEINSDEVNSGIMDAKQFLEWAGDDELLRFLKRLPMVGGSDGGQMTLTDLIYEMKLWPFIKQAWSEVDGSPGIPGRIAQLQKVYKRGEADLKRMTGETRRLPRVIDLPSFLDLYSRVGLP